MFSFYLLSFSFFGVFVVGYIDLYSFAYAVTVGLAVGHIYNTIWFHRYCSHSAFKFKKRWYTLVFLYTDPIFFGDDSYAIPHLVHHAKTDQAGDPYGPHIGWLASFLGPYINTCINPNISEKSYAAIRKRFSHINIKTNDYARFQETGIVESLWRFLIRKLIAQVLWISLSYYLGGVPFVFAYFAGVFVVLTIILDFNWRGHGGNFRFTKKEGWEFDQRTRALNQRIYGLLGSEWHDNHHHYPTSANNGFLPTQFDFSFWVIRTMKRLGIVSHYNDSTGAFKLHRSGLLQEAV
ncbi:MAG: hypothetical protein KTR32_30080 [Granulosicoccus sp.]|nr:hypothetical protein [Granulosicoccus sp.]